MSTTQKKETVASALRFFNSINENSKGKTYHSRLWAAKEKNPKQFEDWKEAQLSGRALAEQIQSVYQNKPLGDPEYEKAKERYKAANFNFEELCDQCTAEERKRLNATKDELKDSNREERFLAKYRGKTTDDASVLKKFRDFMSAKWAAIGYDAMPGYSDQEMADLFFSENHLSTLSKPVEQKPKGNSALVDAMSAIRSRML